MAARASCDSFEGVRTRKAQRGRLTTEVLAQPKRLRDSGLGDMGLVPRRWCSTCLQSVLVVAPPSSDARQSSESRAPDRVKSASRAALGRRSRPRMTGPEVENVGSHGFSGRHSRGGREKHAFARSSLLAKHDTRKEVFFVVPLSLGSETSLFFLNFRKRPEFFSLRGNRLTSDVLLCEIL